MKLKFVKIHENAVLPSNANENDVGLDLVAIEKDTTLESGVILYKTGLKVIPEDGYYVEIVPRSSIVKTGWGLANSVGIIDPSYRGELKIALVKTNPLAEEMELPFCKTQLIVRKCYPIITEETSEFDSTSRNSGGFGSTGNRIN
jgi:dUTP pyrophosphatase